MLKLEIYAMVRKNVGRTILMIFIFSLCAALMFFSMTHNELQSKPYSDRCAELAGHFVEFTWLQCIQYIEEHPTSTGQDVVDHYIVPATPLDELLLSPLAPEG